MKKSVRIRKALPGEKPGYYNKTAKFLQKAQMGMQVGSPSKDPQRLNQIYENVYISLKQSTPPDVVYDELVTEYALDQQTSLSILRAAIGQLSEEGYFDDSALPKKEESEEGAENSEGQEGASEDEQAASDAEQEDLAMSDEGYYDDEEAMNNDRSHLDTEEEEQQQEEAFRFGGYWQDGGESEEEVVDEGQNQEQTETQETDGNTNEYSEDEYSEEYASEDPDAREKIIDQYNYPGQSTMERPFSMEDLMAMTPGMQNTEAFPDLASYLGNYQPVADSYQPESYLPEAQYGKIVKAGLNTLKAGPPILRQPMTNMSTLRKYMPISTLTGEAVSKIPYLGSKLVPKLETSFTQNRNELFNVIQGKSPTTGIFSQTGSYAGGADGSLSVDRLMLYQDDVINIIDNIENSGRSSFSLLDINPIAKSDGLVSGIYPLDSKIVSGVDDNGFKFFELNRTFSPGETLPFGTLPSKGKDVTFKNRFYYNTDEAGQVQVFDPLGNPLSQGAQTKFELTRPFGTTGSRLLTDPILRDPNTPFPSFKTGYEGGRLTETVGEKPMTFADMGIRGKIGRGLETFGFTGLNLPFRTGADAIKKVEYPVFGYTNKALGPNVIDPATEGSYAKDIANSMNYKYRIGRNTLIGLGAAGALGYGTYKAMNPCQCVFPSEPNYMPKDKYGNCPCNTDVGSRRTLDPTGNPYTGPIDQRSLTYPDSMQFLIQQGIYPSKENYYRYQDSNVVNPNMENSIPSDDFAKGGISKAKFIKRFSSMFQEGGEQGSKDPSFGKGKRTDTLTNDVGARKDIFKTKLKTNSNVALTEEIYKNAQGNPQILNMLMQDGKKENLAESSEMGGGMPTAQYGGIPGKRKNGRKLSVGYSNPPHFWVSDKNGKQLYSGKDEALAMKILNEGESSQIDSESNRSYNPWDVLPSNKPFTGKFQGGLFNPQTFDPRTNISYPDLMGGAEDIPSWYTGYENMVTPRQYRKMYRQLSRMMPRGLDISRANIASNFYNRNYTMPPYGDVVTYPEYDAMMDRASTPMYINTRGGSSIPSQFQAEDAVNINNAKGTQFLPELSPDFIDSPIPFEYRGADSPAELSPEDFFPMAERGGFVDTDAKEPLFKFIYGGDEPSYYEPYGLPMAQDGIEITNKAGENRMVADVMPFDEWAEGEKEDFATTHPGIDFDTWKAADESGDDYQKYADFHNKSLQEYQDYGAPANNQTNGNCPAGYKWDGTKCVLIQSNNFTQQTNCPQGMAWSDTYKSCIPIATKKYNQRIVRSNPGFFNTVLPWNAPFGYAGSWTKQMTLPYNLQTGQAYNGQLTGAPVARYVTKKGIFGRPKKWIDVYNTGSGGVNLSELEQLMEQNKRGGKNQSRNESRNESRNQSNKSNNKENKLSRRELLEEDYRKRQGMSKEEWDTTSKQGKKWARQAERYEQGRGMRYKTNEAWENLKDSALGDTARFYGNIGKKVKNFLTRKEYGGAVYGYQLGGTPSAPVNPNAAMGDQTGLIGNVIQGPNTTWGAQQSFNQANNPAPTSNAVTSYNNNPSNFMTTEPGQAGRNLSSCTEAQKNDTTSECYCSPQAKGDPKNTRCFQGNLVGVENKRKDMWNVDPEAGLNVFNAGARGAMGILERWGSGKKERNMLLDNADPMNLYASANEIDRGDWQDFGSKSGAFRYDQQGQDRSSRATYGNYATSKYGGYMQQGGFYEEPAFQEDEEVYMTPEELEQFLQAGGQVEYL